MGRWSTYAGSERSEAQTFLNELFACYGTDRRDVGAEFGFYTGGVGFMDLHWPEVCLIEMKRPTVTVVSAQAQIERYWRVADCYGWPRAVAQDDREIVRRLTELNRQITEGERLYAPFD